MKYIKQFAIILGVTCVGECLKFAIPLPIPASIWGLLLMLLLLGTHVLKVENVKEAAEFLVEIMPVMFIPAGVGLIESWGQLSPILVPVVIITVVSTVAVMAVTGKTTDFLLNKKKGRRK